MFTINKIKTICIWPSASKAYVYKNYIWNAKCYSMEMYNSCKYTVGLCVKLQCARLTPQWKRLKTEIMNPGGGKSLKSRIVHGMFIAIASPVQTYLYKENLSNTINLHDEI